MKPSSTSVVAPSSSSSINSIKSKVGLDIESAQLVEQSVKVAQRYMEKALL